MSLAPIVLFVYNRLDHTTRVVHALLDNPLAEASELHIYSDAPKDADALQKVSAVRNYIKSIKGFKHVHIHLREHNLGVDENVILGVTEVINNHGKAIVMEDDLVTSPHFLQYMNDALDLYEKEEDVISIHGYVYPVTQQLKEVFFLKGADCWGWATWKRGWDLFERNGGELLAKIEEQGSQSEFDIDNTYPYVQALREQATGKTTCWDIRWYASAFIMGKLTLYPGQSLVSNIGHDGSGTHCEANNSHDVLLASSPLNVRTPIQPDPEAYFAFADFLRKLYSGTPARKKNWLSKLFKQTKNRIRQTFHKQD